MPADQPAHEHSPAPTPTDGAFADRARGVHLLLMDVDGTLTDGALFVSEDNVESRRFCVRDGQAIAAWKRLERPVGIITARPARAALMRARELGIDAVREGVEDKRQAVHELLERFGVTPERAAFIGDDLSDVRAMRAVGCPIAVADADAFVRSLACMTTRAAGGFGAVREAIWAILEVQGELQRVYEMYS